MDQKQLLLDFLTSQKHMVLATSSHDIPEAALVGFYAKDNLEIIFGTSSTSRKIQNIQDNSRVAGVVSSDKTSVQFEGIATIIIGDAIAEDKQGLFDKIAGAAAYDTDPNQLYLRIVPIWFRYTDYAHAQPVLFEFRP